MTLQSDSSDDAGLSAPWISARDLKAHLDGGREYVVLDVRHAEANRTGYEVSHLPKAIQVRFPAALSGQGGGTRGRLPLPELEDFQRTARQWGINNSSEVVVYGDRGPASRTWWVLRWFGFRSVRILDGGLKAWTAAGYPVESAPFTPAPGGVTFQSGGHMPILDADGAQQIARSGILLDARGIESYRGFNTAPGETPQGHIPGAWSAPTDDNLDTAGKLHQQVLRQRFAKWGIKEEGGAPLGVYCGGGVGATHEIAVLESLGIPAALFPGSWSAWSADPNRPVAKGDERG